MASSTVVGIIGASGETGSSIINGLLSSPNAKDFHIVALVRPSSLNKPANLALKDRGIELRPITLDTETNPSTLLPTLAGINILLSAVGPIDQLTQIPLATAAAQTPTIKRFLPCAYITVIPVDGNHHHIRSQKERVYAHIKSLEPKLPYTIVDVGWWYQLSIPKLQSGKTDYIRVGFSRENEIPGDGNVPSALIDVTDIGKYVARIIQDDRTANKYVLAYNEVWTPNQTHELFSRLSGEDVSKVYVSEAELQKRVEDVPEVKDFFTMAQKSGPQYMLSWGIHGHNTPEFAKKLGYLTSKELYPDLESKSFEKFAKEVLDGKAKTVYDELRAQIQSLQKGQ